MIRRKNIKKPREIYNTLIRLKSKFDVIKKNLLKKRSRFNEKNNENNNLDFNDNVNISLDGRDSIISIKRYKKRLNRNNNRRNNIELNLKIKENR